MGLYLYIAPYDVDSLGYELMSLEAVTSGRDLRSSFMYHEIGFSLVNGEKGIVHVVADASTLNPGSCCYENVLSLAALLRVSKIVNDFNEPTLLPNLQQLNQ